MNTDGSAAAGVVTSVGNWPAHRVPARSRIHRFYVAVTFLLIAIVARGFWPSYFGPLVNGGVTRPWVVHLHGAIFSGWMALLLLQVSLAASGRVDLHRRVGSIGIVYGVLVLTLGLAVAFAASVLHVRAGEWTRDEAAAFLLLPLVDMILFAGFFTAAIVYRRQPEIHKRLMLAATVALAFAAIGRMPVLRPGAVPDLAVAASGRHGIRPADARTDPRGLLRQLRHSCRGVLSSALSAVRGVDDDRPCPADSLCLRRIGLRNHISP